MSEKYTVEGEALVDVLAEIEAAHVQTECPECGHVCGLRRGPDNEVSCRRCRCTNTWHDLYELHLTPDLQVDA